MARPPGTREQNLDRRFDQTQLRENMHGKLVHRDYAAHFFRWGYAQRFVKAGARVLDIGCGQDLPLQNILGASPGTVPELYVGVDMNKLRECKRKWVLLLDEFNFIDDYQQVLDHERVGGKGFSLITCFEVLEHMHVDDGVKLLAAMKASLAPGGQILLSTPVYNGRKMAANHIHEYGFQELQGHILTAGFTIDRLHGTFASWPELKKVLTDSDRELYEELLQYYSHDVLSCFLAPKYPEASRNIVWVLK